MARLVSGSNLKPRKHSVMGMALSRSTGGKEVRQTEAAY